MKKIEAEEWYSQLDVFSSFTDFAFGFSDVRTGGDTFPLLQVVKIQEG